MGAFIVAGLVFAFGVVAFFVGVIVYSSYPAPSVQGDAQAPWVWLIGCTILSVIVAATHWLPPIGW